MTNDELERMSMEADGLILWYHPSMSWKGHRKTTEDLSQNSQSQVRFKPRTSQMQGARANHSRVTKSLQYVRFI